jgi:CBS domain containing-hemolysin-like protein
MIVAAEETLSGSALAWYFVAAVVLIALNGVYVAYEFAILAARRSTFESAQEADRPTSKAALASMSDLTMQLAGAQLGITMASLALGYVGEPAFAAVIEAAIGAALSPEVTHVVGIVVSLTIVVFLHLVIGEMAPKNIALAAPEATMRWLVLPYRAYLAVVRPFVVLLNGMANLGCRLVGIEPRDELVAVHSAAELAAIVSHASEGGSIEADSAELLSGALDFARRTVDEVAVPIEELATLRLGATAAQAERVVAASGQERIPIVGPDQQLRLIGYVHARDLATVDASRRQLPLPPDLVRQMAVVRADRSLTETLQVLRRVGRQMALVVAAGEPVGVISVENIIRALIEPTGQPPEPVKL